ncbi:MAG: hypothetical protein ACRDPK_06290 [Carbonactinosporaceae bacterium]
MDARVRAGLLDVIDATTAAGWSTAARRCCSAFDLDRVRRWATPATGDRRCRCTASCPPGGRRSSPWRSSGAGSTARTPPARSWPPTPSCITSAAFHPTDQAGVEWLFAHVNDEWRFWRRSCDAGEFERELDRVRHEYNAVRLHASVG